MILSTRDLAAVWLNLQSAPFRSLTSLAGEVETVLRLGNGKYMDEPEASGLSHVEHAQKHFQTNGIDSETGCSHRAHGIARLVLAIAAACRKDD
jgi:predicted TIM-barrel fold metal-dependent hydrolase